VCFEYDFTAYQIIYIYRNKCQNKSLSLYEIKTVLSDTSVTKTQLYQKNDKIEKNHREWKDFAFIYLNA